MHSLPLPLRVGAGEEEEEDGGGRAAEEDAETSDSAEDDDLGDEDYSYEDRTPENSRVSLQEEPPSVAHILLE